MMMGQETHSILFFLEFALVALIHIHTVLSVKPRSRVDIDDNCFHMKNGESFDGDAKGLETVVRVLKPQFELPLTLLYVLDSELTLGSTSPTQRIQLAKFCENQWKKAENGQELCYLFPDQAEGLKVRAKYDAEGMMISGKELKGHLCKINTKTFKAQECFKTVKDQLIPFRNIARSVIEDAVIKREPVEKLIFADVLDGTSRESPAIVLVLSRKALIPTDPIRNIGISANLVFMSPYHSAERIHSLKLAATLDQKSLDELIKKGDFSLIELLRRFGIQAVIVNAKLDAAILNLIVTWTERSGASRFAMNEQFISPAEKDRFIVFFSIIDCIERNPLLIRKTPLTDGMVRDQIMQDSREGQRAKRKFPCNIEYQILVIGDQISQLSNSLRLDMVAAGKLAKRPEAKRPETMQMEGEATSKKPEETSKKAEEISEKAGGKKEEQPTVAQKGQTKTMKTTPESTEGQARGVEDAVREIIKQYPTKGTVTRIDFDIQDSWYSPPYTKPRQMNIEGRVINIFYVGSPGYQRTFGKNVVLVTNKRKQYTDSKARNFGAVYYDASIYATTEYPLYDYISLNPNDAKFTGEKLQASVKNFFKDYDFTMVADKKAVTLLKNAGLDGYCVAPPKKINGKLVEPFRAEAIQKAMEGIGYRKESCPTVPPPGKYLMLHLISDKTSWKNFKYHYGCQGEEEPKQRK